MEQENQDLKAKYIYESKSYDMKWYRHVICFFLGWFGLKVIATIVTLIIGYAMTGNEYDLEAASVAFTQFSAGETYDKFALEVYIFEVMLVQVISYIALVIFILCSLLVNPLKDIFKGFANKDSWLHGIFYGALLVLGQSAISVITNLLAPDVGSNANQSIITILSQKYYIPMFIVTVFCAPIAEEITYRLGLFGFLNKKNKYLALIGSALIFALIHFDFTARGNDLIVEFINLPSYIYAGVILGLCYSRSGRLSDSIICHMTNNLVSMIAVLLIK